MGGRWWAEEEIKYLKDNYANSIRTNIPLKMQRRTHYAIVCKATKMGFATDHKCENNPMWKNYKSDFKNLHQWIHRRKPKPKNCQNCNKEYKRLDLANISQEYRWDINDYKYLCRKCHMLEDGRLKRLNEHGKKRYTEGKLLRDSKGRFIN